MKRGARIDRRAGPDLEPHHHAEQHHRCEEEVHDRHGDPGEREKNAGEVDLRDESTIGNEAGAGERHRRREVRPREKRRIREDRIRNALGREVGESPEDECKDDHRQERLQDRPQHADRRLLVAHRDVSPCERQQQLPVLPELQDVEVWPARCRADRGQSLDAFGRGTWHVRGARCALGNLELRLAHRPDGTAGPGPGYRRSARAMSSATARSSLDPPSRATRRFSSPSASRSAESDMSATRIRASSSAFPGAARYGA